VQYKDGSKVRPEEVPPPPKVKEEPKETTLKHEAKDALKTANRFFKKGADYFEGKIKGANGGAASPALTDTIVTAKTNSDTLTIIPIPLPVLAGKDDKGVIGIIGDCEDVEFDKGFHDAEAHYLGKKARNSVMITTFFFAPAGLVTWAAMHPFKPRPRAGYASDIKLIDNHDYIDGYKLKAAATKKVRMRHGFWWGLGATFVTTTTLYFATGANHDDGSGTGGGGGVHWHHH
jgi:hypothetical protein